MTHTILALLLITGSVARGAVWLDAQSPSLRLVCSDPIEVDALDAALNGQAMDVYATLRLTYPSGLAANEADLEAGTSVRFKLRRFTLTRDQPANVVSLFARPTRVNSVLADVFEKRVLALSADHHVFEPLINDPQAPHVDLNAWIKMRGLERFREALGHDFVPDVNEEIASYQSDARTIHTWSHARVHPFLKRRYTELLATPFLVFALDQVSLILASDLRRVSVCVARNSAVNWPRVHQTVQAWLNDDGVKRMLTCEAALRP